MYEPIITAGELEALKRLPPHVPGKVITLTLDQLSDYLAMNGLKVTSMAGDMMLVQADE